MLVLGAADVGAVLIYGYAKTFLVSTGVVIFSRRCHRDVEPGLSFQTALRGVLWSYILIGLLGRDFSHICPQLGQQNDFLGRTSGLLHVLFLGNHRLTIPINIGACRKNSLSSLQNHHPNQAKSTWTVCNASFTSDIGMASRTFSSSRGFWARWQIDFF